MICLHPNALELAKTGIFAAFGSITKDGEKLKIELEDGVLEAAAQMALESLLINTFGSDAHFEKD